MTGIIRIRGEALFVEHTSVQYTQPRQIVMLWRVSHVVRCAYSPRWPADGDEVTSSSDTAWSGRGYSVHFPGNLQAEESRTEEIPAPKVRKGTEVRWQRGQWEKYSKREGWVRA